jgi:glucuronokinase
MDHDGDAEPDGDRSVTRTVPARVGLVGNPSDGYGGAVLATVVPRLVATVTATTSDEVAFRGGGAIERWPSIGHWTAHITAAGHGEAQRIISAALWTLDEHVARGGDRPRVGVSIEWRTDVPRSVGLAGSSALAVAVIDAAACVWGVELDRRVVAALALRAERDVLGIAAGWQDRIVQAFGTTVLVDASEMEVVDGIRVPSVSQPSLPSSAALDLLVGWSDGSATSSDDYHAPLRRRADELAAPMAALADAARRSAAALAAGDLDAFSAAVDATWTIRQSCAPLRPDHAALVELVRSTGVVATTPGSGGAVVGIAVDAEAAARAVDALTLAGCRSIRVRLTGAIT